MIRETIGNRFASVVGRRFVPSVVLSMRCGFRRCEDWRDDLVDLIAHGTGYSVGRAGAAQLS